VVVGAYREDTGGLDAGSAYVYKLPFGEECDDGNTDEDDGCSSTCAVEVCGDGTLDSGGTLMEECDDGNTVGGDGCASNCTWNHRMSVEIISRLEQKSVTMVTQ